MTTFYSSANDNTGRQLRMPEGAVYGFPKMTTSDILSCLAELGCQVSKEQLLHPEEHKDTIKALLEYLAQICLGITADDLTQPAFAGLQAIHYPELHEDSIAKLNSLRSIMKMMEICDISDFSLRDLMAPDAKRLNRQLSGIMNFAKFREERLLLLNELNVSREDLVNNVQAVREKNDQLNSRLSLLRQQTQQEEQAIVSLEEDCADLEATISSLQSQQTSYENELGALQDEYLSLKEQVARAEEERDDLRSVHSRLSSQIVTSPEKFRRQILEIGQSLQHEQRDTKAAEKKVRELTAWLANIDQAQGEVNSALEAINEVRNEVERQKNMISDLDGHKSRLSSLQAALSELRQNSQQQSRSIARFEEKISSLRRQATQRATDSQENMEALHKQIVEAEAFRLQAKSRAERLEGEAQRLEKELQVENATRDQELQDIRSTYAKLEKKVIVHLQSLQRQLEISSPQTDRSPQGRFV